MSSIPPLPFSLGSSVTYCRSGDWVARPQVSADHYQGNYVFHDRWCQYYWQLQQAIALNPKRVLLVGVGDGIVPFALQKHGVDVTTLDIAPDLKPDITCAVDKMPFADSSFDVVICCEVLEHMPYHITKLAMNEIYRVTRTACLVSVPHSVLSFALLLRLPILHLHEFRFRVPIKICTRFKPGPEHHWELGYRGYSLRRFKNDLKAVGFTIASDKRMPTEYSCANFVLLKSM